MRTLDELLQVAKQAEANYKARVSSADRELEAETEAAHKAQEAAGIAIACGDKNAYAQSMQEDEYHRGRAAMLRKQKVSPMLTPAENNAIVDEANSAYLVEVKPMYRHLCELMAEWNNTVKQLEKKTATINAIGSRLSNARMRDYEVMRMLPSERPYNPNAYHSTMGCSVSSCLDILNADVRREIGWNKYRAEVASNE